MDQARKLLVLGVASLVTACTAILGVEDVPNAPTPDAGSAEASVDSGPSLPAIVNAFALANCQRYQACQPNDFDFNYANMDACVAARTVGVNYALALPGTGLDAAVYITCTAQVMALSCDDFASAASELLCTAKGTKAIGQNCIDNSQCASGFCGSDNTTCRGCIAPPQNGEACAPGDQCDLGLVCADGKCVHEATLGGACDATAHPCIPTLACQNGSCVPLPASVGATCGDDLPCNTGKGFVCNGSTLKCITYTISAPGGACSTTDTTQSACRLDATCTNGTCGTPPTENQPCDATKGPFCTDPLRCINSVCSALPAVSFCN